MIARKRSCSRSRIARVAQEVARDELEVLEVERRLASFAARVRAREAVEQRLEQVAVARGELVERGLLDRLARLLVGGGALAAARGARERSSSRSGDGSPARSSSTPRGVRALQLRRAGVVGEAARRLAQLLDALRERRPLAELEHELAAGRAQRLVDAVSIRRSPAAP